MSRILIIAEHDGAHLDPGTAKCVTCAAALPGAQISIAVLARDPAAVAAQAAALAGVAQVLAVANPANEAPHGGGPGPADRGAGQGFPAGAGTCDHLPART